MSLHITVVDEQTGDTDTCVLSEGDYLLIAHDPCYLAHTTAHANGTHVLTVKGRKGGETS